MSYPTALCPSPQRFLRCDLGVSLIKIVTIRHRRAFCGTVRQMTQRGGVRCCASTMPMASLRCLLSYAMRLCVGEYFKARYALTTRNDPGPDLGDKPTCDHARAATEQAFLSWYYKDVRSRFVFDLTKRFLFKMSPHQGRSN